MLKSWHHSSEACISKNYLFIMFFHHRRTTKENRFVCALLRLRCLGCRVKSAASREVGKLSSKCVVWKWWGPSHRVWIPPGHPRCVSELANPTLPAPSQVHACAAQGDMHREAKTCSPCRKLTGKPLLSWKHKAVLALLKCGQEGQLWSSRPCPTSGKTRLHSKVCNGIAVPQVGFYHTSPTWALWV